MPCPWEGMRFSRHAKNKMRLYGITQAEVSGIISPENRAGVDRDGNLLYMGKISKSLHLWGACSR